MFYLSKNIPLIFLDINVITTKKFTSWQRNYKEYLAFLELGFNDSYLKFKVKN